LRDVDSVLSKEGFKAGERARRWPELTNYHWEENIRPNVPREDLAIRDLHVEFQATGQPPYRPGGSAHYPALMTARKTR
jgi:hypothetical protein